MKETQVGVITHYYDHIGVGVVEVSGALKIGDQVHIKGKATDFTQEVTSMQVEHKQIDAAKKGDAIGMKVGQEVEERDVVYKVEEQFLTPNSEFLIINFMYIGIDIGGTHIRTALGEKGKIEKKTDFPTAEFHTSLQEIKEAVGNLSSGQQIKRIGVGVPGPLDIRSGKLVRIAHLIGWDNIEIADIFTKLLKLPVLVGHDASLAALGEFHHGAGQNRNPMLYITVSTGIGVGLIVDGKMYKGVYNPEAGHQILGLAGNKCVCGQEADLETYASGAGIEKLTGKHPVEAEGTKIWAEAMEWLGIGVANLILHYAPEIVVIGGGMTKHKNLFFPLLESSLKKHLRQLPPAPIVPAALGADSGIIGALTLAEKVAKIFAVEAKWVQ